MTEDEVKAVVREAFGEEPNRESLWPRVEAIASRVAAQLAGRVGLSDGDVFALKLAASDRQLRADRPALCEALDRLLGGKP